MRAFPLRLQDCINCKSPPIPNYAAAQQAAQDQKTTRVASRLQVAVPEPDHPAYLVIVEEGVTSGSEQSTNIESTQSTVKPGATKPQRPCKGKRLRYRKFVQRLKQQALENPNSFDMKDVELLPSLLNHAERRERLMLYMERFQRNLKCAEDGDNIQ